MKAIHNNIRNRKFPNNVFYEKSRFPKIVMTSGKTAFYRTKDGLRLDLTFFNRNHKWGDLYMLERKEMFDFEAGLNSKDSGIAYLHNLLLLKHVENNLL